MEASVLQSQALERGIERNGHIQGGVSGDRQVDAAEVHCGRVRAGNEFREVNVVKLNLFAGGKGE